MFRWPTSNSTENVPNMLPYSLNPNPNIPYVMKNETLYPTISSIPSTTRGDCHPLQGIPFKLAPILELSQNVQQDPELEDVKQTLERVKNLLSSKDFNYDCTLERNCLTELGHKG